MEPLGRKSFRSMPSYRQSSRGRSYRKQIERTAKAAEKVTNTTCKHWDCSFFSFSYFQQPSTLTEPSITCDHELGSSSLTITSLPLLVLTRRRSQSLTNEMPDALEKKDGISDPHRSDSFDSLNLGNVPFIDPRSPQGVLMIISPTSESSLIKHDSVCLEDSIEAMENNVCLNFLIRSL